MNEGYIRSVQHSSSGFRVKEHGHVYLPFISGESAPVLHLDVSVDNRLQAPAARTCTLPSVDLFHFGASQPSCRSLRSPDLGHEPKLNEHSPGGSHFHDSHLPE